MNHTHVKPSAQPLPPPVELICCSHNAALEVKLRPFIMALCWVVTVLGDWNVSMLCHYLSFQTVYEAGYLSCISSERVIRTGHCAVRSNSLVNVTDSQKINIHVWIKSKFSAFMNKWCLYCYYLCLHWPKEGITAHIFIYSWEVIIYKQAVWSCSVPRLRNI